MCTCRTHRMRNRRGTGGDDGRGGGGREGGREGGRDGRTDGRTEREEREERQKHTLPLRFRFHASDNLRVNIEALADLYDFLRLRWLTVELEPVSAVEHLVPVPIKTFSVQDDGKMSRHRNFFSRVATFPTTRCRSTRGSTGRAVGLETCCP